MPANLENSAFATGLEQVSFHSNEVAQSATPWTAAFQAPPSIVFQMFKLDLEKTEKPEIKLPTSIVS